MIKTSTCIVGIKHNGVVYIGGDSLCSTDTIGYTGKNKKVFHLQDKEDLIVGFAGSYRMGQLLQYSELFPEDDFKIEGKTDEKYLVTTFIPKLQNLFSAGGYQTVDKEELSGGTFLLGYKDKLYKIQSDYSIMEKQDDYVAIGCGEELALGSLHTTEGLGWSIEKRLEYALKVASKYSVYVAPPFYMVSTDNMEVKEI